jgi:hypothetical protein
MQNPRTIPQDWYVNHQNDDAREGAEQALNELRAALERRGIDIPDLGLYLPGVLAGCPVISLGVITAETARQLTAALLCDTL